MYSMDKKLILFDLDGVLIDSRINMEQSWALTCKYYEINVQFKDYFINIGRPFQEILDILEIRDNQREIEIFFNKESTKLIHLVNLYDGVISLLNFIKKKKLKVGIVTSKNEIKTKKIIEYFGLSFDIVQSPNNLLKGKPSPDHILEAISKLRVSAKDTIYIGDMNVDYQAANSAGVDYIHALWGYGDCKGKNVIKVSQISKLMDVI
jgi:phosphoglycolate phosphatase